MIGSLKGKLESKTDQYVIVDVNGVGYKVFCSKETISNISPKDGLVKLFTYLYIRENEMELYGFVAQEELELFELLISISGIGPKGALSILAVASPQDLRLAILSGNDKLLTKVSGIGKKTAQKIILELKGKIEKMGFEGMPEADLGALEDKHDAIEALISLGYRQKEAREALSKVPQDIEDVGERVKEALKILGK